MQLAGAGYQSPKGKLMSTNTTERPYPESVYRWVDQGPVEMAVGEPLPPFATEVAERIAASKPDWASFEDTDINGDALSSNREYTSVTWVRDFGNVSVNQDAAYVYLTGELVSQEPPLIVSWTENFTDPAEARTHGANLQAASDLLKKLLTASK